jgi:hypothetical protein
MNKIKKLYLYEGHKDINKYTYIYNHNFYFSPILRIYLYPVFWEDRVKFMIDGSSFFCPEKQIYVYFDIPIYYAFF